MTANRRAVILVIGDRPYDVSHVVTQFKPEAFGFLCYSNEGLVDLTEFVKSSGIDLSCCRFEIIQGLADKKDFFKRTAVLADFLSNQCGSQIIAVCVGTANLEALALAAMVAHQRHAVLRIDSDGLHLAIDPTSASLVSALSDIVKQFNLSHYGDALAALEGVRPMIRSAKGKAYALLVEKLANAYYDWDCRRYSDAHQLLHETKDLLTSTRDDFSSVYDHFLEKLNANVEFLEMLDKDQEGLGAVDAFFSGNRRYDATDNLIAILALANSVEFCFRSRLFIKGYDPDDSKKLSKTLLDRFKDEARKFLIEKKFFHVDAKDDGKGGFSVLKVVPKITHKPGFQDLVEILEFTGDEFFKEVEGLINASENPNYLSIMQLNTLRNKIVHRMGIVNEEDLPKAIKLTEFIMEKFLALLVTDRPKSFPNLDANGSDSLIAQARQYATHIRLDIQDIALGMFG